MLGSATVHSRGTRSTSTIELSTLEAVTINHRTIATVDTTAIGMEIEEQVPGITFCRRSPTVWEVALVMEIMVTETQAMGTMVDTITTTAMEMAGDGVWAAAIEEVADTEATAATVIGHWDGDSADGALAR